MANQSAKSRAKANAVYVRNLQLLLGGVNALYVLLRVWLDGSDALWTFGFVFSFLVTSLLYGAAYWFIERTGRAAYDANGQLIDGGGDLSVGGQTELAFDVVYLTALAQLAALYSSSAFWLLALIPLFAGYKGWQIAKPFVQQYLERAQALKQQLEQQQQQQQRQQQRQSPAAAGKSRKK